MATPEEVPSPRQKLPTAMENAFANANAKVETREINFGDLVTETLRNLPPQVRPDVEESAIRVPQYMPENLRELQEEIDSLGHTPETAAMVAPNETVVQVETKIPVGEATELYLPVLNELVSKENDEDSLKKYRDALEAGDVDEALKHEKAAHLIKNSPEYASPKLEGTPRENRGRFLEVMNRVKEKFGMSERAEKLQTFFSKRLNELNAETQKIGTLEKGFRFLGEQYKKAGWKTKLAVGISLGVGSGIALSAASMPTAIACLSGIAVQRVAGMSSSFLKYEKEMQNEKWGKEKAMGKAMRNTALMTGTMLLLVEGVKEGIEYTKEHEWGDATQEWLKAHWPFGEAKLPVHSQMRGVVTAELSKMPIVGASDHGYEGTLMEAFAKVHQPGFHVATNLDPQSDLGRLLAADNLSIGKVAHEIAIKNGFYHADGTSAVIHTHDSLTFDEKGNSLFTSGHETVVAASQTVDAQTSAPLHILEPHLTSDSPSEWSPDVHHEAGGITETHKTFDPTKAYMQNGPLDTINLHGITVLPHESHLYIGLNAKGEQNVCAYGSTFEDKKKLIEEFLTRNPDKIVYTEDAQAHRVLFHSMEGKVLEGPVMRIKGGFLALSSTFMQPPHPDEFVEILP